MIAPVLALVLSLAGSPGSQPSKDVSPGLMAKLTRGVNVSRWFCYCAPDDTARFRDYLVHQDIENFQRLGVHFVRLCVAPDTIYRDGQPDAGNLPYLDAAIDRLERPGLAVVLDLHDTHGKMKLDAPGHDNSGLVSFWTAMARHYKGKAESSTVFEIVNEPIFRQNPDDWYRLQVQTVDAIRAVDPDRTILVASTKFDSVDTLVKMKPLEEGNLIYSFHFYDPFLFTHQGATWSTDEYKATHDLPFPSSPEGVAQVADQLAPQFRDAVVKYGAKRFDAAYLRKRLTLAADWGAQNHVPVLLGEFGCYPPHAPVDSRARWFEGMRDAIESLHLPNCLWAYDDVLGLGRKKSPDDSIHLDPVTLQHLFGVTN